MILSSLPISLCSLSEYLRRNFGWKLVQACHLLKTVDASGHYVSVLFCKYFLIFLHLIWVIQHCCFVLMQCVSFCFNFIQFLPFVLLCEILHHLEFCSVKGTSSIMYTLQLFAAHLSTIVRRISHTHFKAGMTVVIHSFFDAPFMVGKVWSGRG